MQGGPETWGDWKRQWQRVILNQPNRGYEWEFVRQVLVRVPGLRPGDVTPQRAFVGSDGRELHMDFAIESHGLKLAIEVEGFDKAGDGRGKTSREHDDLMARIQAVQDAGWKAIPITNAQFLADPDRYVSRIRRELIDAEDSGQRGGSASAEPAVEKRSGTRRLSGLHWIAICALVLGIVGLAVLAFALGDESDSLGVDPLSAFECPTSHPVKGNEARGGDLIFHVPGGEFYEATTPVECFVSSGDARRAGYRPSFR